jgi:CheY-like chemotaxis protein
MKTILLVDDEYALLENLTELLQGEGYRVVTATNGKDALSRLQHEKPDLVVTDFMMPIADGRDLIRGMRALPQFRSTPVVMMTATIRAVALADEDVALEVSEFLKKPFRWQKLRDAVLRLIGRPDDPSGSEA